MRSSGNAAAVLLISLYVSLYSAYSERHRTKMIMRKSRDHAEITPKPRCLSRVFANEPTETPMKILSFVHNGMPGVGIFNGNGVVDLRKRANASSLRALLESGGLAGIEAYATDEPDFSLRDVRFLPVVADPRHYHLRRHQLFEAHRRSRGRRHRPQEAGHAVDLSARRRKASPPTANRYGFPAVSRCLDYEGELAVIIGKGGRYIAAKNALAHVAGYAASTTAVSATGNSTRTTSHRERTSPARARSVRGSFPRMKFRTRTGFASARASATRSCRTATRRT